MEQQEGPGQWVGQDLADTPLRLLGLRLTVGSRVCLSSWTLPNPPHLGLLTAPSLPIRFRNSIQIMLSPFPALQQSCSPSGSSQNILRVTRKAELVMKPFSDGDRSRARVRPGQLSELMARLTSRTRHHSAPSLPDWRHLPSRKCGRSSFQKTDVLCHCCGG